MFPFQEKIQNEVNAKLLTILLKGTVEEHASYKVQLSAVQRRSNYEGRGVAQSAAMGPWS